MCLSQYLLISLLQFVVHNVEAGGLFECLTVDDCIASGSKCENNLCTCPLGYTLNSEGSKCYKIASEINGPCEINEQCALLTGSSECRDGVCQCSQDHHYLKRFCVKRLLNFHSCATSDDCFDGIDYHARQCVKGTCQCTEGYYNRRGYDCRRISGLGNECAINCDCQDSEQVCNRGICEKRKSDYNVSDMKSHLNLPEMEMEDDEFIYFRNESVLANTWKNCKNNQECQEADRNSICSGVFRTCQCRRGYFYNAVAKKCLAELGMQCEIDRMGKSNCADKTECINGVCSCGLFQVYNSLNRKCRKSAKLPGLVCSTDDSCKLLVNNYYCDGNDLDKVCKCQKGFALNEDYHICIASCKDDADCQITLPHSICSADNRCICPPEYIFKDNQCLPRIGGLCLKDDDCTEDNSSCVNGACACADTHVTQEYACLPKRALDHTCNVDKQCEWKWNSTCLHNVCKCKDGFVNVSGNCLKVAHRVGDYCTHPNVCMKGAVCRKSKCACESNFVSSLNGDECQLADEINSSTMLAAEGRNRLMLLPVAMFFRMYFLQTPNIMKTI